MPKSYVLMLYIPVYWSLPEDGDLSLKHGGGLTLMDMQFCNICVHIYIYTHIYICVCVCVCAFYILWFCFYKGLSYGHALKCTECKNAIQEVTYNPLFARNKFHSTWKDTWTVQLLGYIVLCVNMSSIVAVPVNMSSIVAVPVNMSSIVAVPVNMSSIVAVPVNILVTAG